MVAVLSRESVPEDSPSVVLMSSSWEMAGDEEVPGRAAKGLSSSAMLNVCVTFAKRLRPNVGNQKDLKFNLTDTGVYDGYL